MDNQIKIGDLFFGYYPNCESKLVAFYVVKVNKKTYTDWRIYGVDENKDNEVSIKRYLDLVLKHGGKNARIQFTGQKIKEKMIIYPTIKQAKENPITE